MANDPVVHVIDDDNAARDSVAFLLGSAKFVVYAYASAKAFLDALPTLKQGCIISDLKMPEVDGMEFLKRLKNQKVEWPIILITGHADLPLAIAAIRLGAADFIEKPYDADVLLDAVRIGFNSLDNEVKQPKNVKLRERMATLSETERQVLDAVVAGHTSEVVAKQLAISKRGVEIHRANIITKLQAESLSQLVRMVLIAGT
jgi:two-component system, LuxR family, response regulator FixJ